MDNQKKQSCGFLLVAIILNVIINAMLTVNITLNLLLAPKIEWSAVVLALAVLLWQWANIGLCAFYYFSGDKVPKFVRIYLYIDIGIFGLLVLVLLYVAVCLMIEYKAPTIFLALAIAWGYAGINMLMAYLVIQTRTQAPMFMLVATNVKQEEVIAS